MNYTPTQIKNEALAKLENNWGNLVLATFIFFVITGLSSLIPFGGLLVGGPLAMGTAILFLNFVRNGNTDVNQMFDGFKDFGNALGAYILMALVVFGFMLLLIIPGIIAALALSQTYRVMKDNPHLDIIESMKRSRDIMQGHKTDLFILNLSFIGWSILCLFTVGIGFLWLVPYVNTTNTIFYNKLVDHDELKDFAKDVQY